MLIKSLQMKNFRQFKGEQKVVFSCDSQQNVTVVQGKNSSGKTTLLQAFNWCLYDQADFDDKLDDKSLINRDILEGAKENKEVVEVEVAVTVEHDLMEYVITRTQQYTNGRKKGNNSKVEMTYKQSNGVTKFAQDTRQIENAINKILPEKLFTYFFFDAERINKISNSKELNKAVEGLLGLTVMENAIGHLGKQSKQTSAIGKLYADMSEGANERLEEKNKEIQKLGYEQQQKEKELDEVKKEIEKYKKTEQEKYKELKENEDTAKLQKDMEKLERDISEYTGDMKKLNEKYYDEFNSGSLWFFARPLFNEVNKFLGPAKSEYKGVNSLKASAIEDLIKRGECICGQKICEENSAYRNLKELKDALSENYDNMLPDFRKKLSEFSCSTVRFYDTLCETYKKINEYKDKIQKKKEEKDKIERKIKEAGNKKYRAILDEYENARKQIDKFEGEKDELNKELGNIEGEIKRCKKEWNNLKADSDKNEKVERYIGYAEEILERFSKELDEQKKPIREELEKKVNENFKKMSHAEKRVQISEGYEVSLLTTVGDKEIEDSASEGLKKVKCFAFIAGLVQCAKEKMDKNNSGNGRNLISESYPMVMDAPFSNVDQEHITNISKILPEIADQVIMFVMEKDWKYAEAEMENRVGTTLILEKQNENYTELREE